MTDKQRLIYDLSLLCAAEEVRRFPRKDITLQAQALDAFTASILMYSCMSDAQLYAALEELKKVSP